MGQTSPKEQPDGGSSPKPTQIEASLDTLAETIRALRAKRGFRLTDLAAATGLSEVHLYRIEQGERTPSIRALLTLASVYGVDPGQLLAPTTRSRRISAHRGEAVWEGRERSGSGRMVTRGGSFRYDAESRLSDSEGQSDGEGTRGSPEELIATALAGCFSMSLADRLDMAGFEPHRIETRADVLLALTANGVSITEIRLDCDGDVDGIDEERLAEIAQITKRTCVVSRALMAVPLTLNVRLVRQVEPAPRERDLAVIDETQVAEAQPEDRQRETL
jgi:osmotically inducible protein OsmC